MSITTTQKLIKIGTSTGSTFPAKALRELGAKAGDEVIVTIELAEKKSDRLDAEYEKFKEQYGETLKNLADR